MQVIKIRSSQGGLGKADGAEQAPDQIEKELENLYAKENGEEIEFSFTDVEIVESNIEETNKNIFLTAQKFVDKKPIFLGGDHSITYPLIKAFGKVGVVIFDAHPDAENDFMPPTQEDLIPAIIKIGIKPENILLVGTRNWHKNEIEFLEQHKIRYLHMKEIMETGISEIGKMIAEFCEKQEKIYLSIDIDVLDPANAPGTGYCEPGGLTTRELLYLLGKIDKEKIVATDIMEINPKKDANNMTSKIGAKLLLELSN